MLDSYLSQRTKQDLMWLLKRLNLNVLDRWVWRLATASF